MFSNLTRGSQPTLCCWMQQLPIKKDDQVSISDHPAMKHYFFSRAQELHTSPALRLLRPLRGLRLLRAVRGMVVRPAWFHTTIHVFANMETERGMFSPEGAWSVQPVLLKEGTKER